MKEKIILIGGGGHCKSCIDVIEQEGRFDIEGIVDLKEKIGNKVLGYDIIGTDDDLPRITKEYKNFLITIGQIRTPDFRIWMFKKLKELNGCNLHSTHIPTPGDEAGLRRLGLNITSDPNFSSKSLFII